LWVKEHTGRRKFLATDYDILKVNYILKDFCHSKEICICPLQYTCKKHLRFLRFFTASHEWPFWVQG